MTPVNAAADRCCRRNEDCGVCPENSLGCRGGRSRRNEDCGVCPQDSLGCRGRRCGRHEVRRICPKGAGCCRGRRWQLQSACTARETGYQGTRPLPAVPAREGSCRNTMLREGDRSGACARAKPRFKHILCRFARRAGARAKPVPACPKSAVLSPATPRPAPSNLSRAQPAAAFGRGASMCAAAKYMIRLYKISDLFPRLAAAAGQAMGRFKFGDALLARGSCRAGGVALPWGVLTGQGPQSRGASHS